MCTRESCVFAFFFIFSFLSVLLKDVDGGKQSDKAIDFLAGEFRNTVENMYQVTYVRMKERKKSLVLCRCVRKKKDLGCTYTSSFTTLPLLLLLLLQSLFRSGIQRVSRLVPLLPFSCLFASVVLQREGKRMEGIRRLLPCCFDDLCEGWGAWLERRISHRESRILVKAIHQTMHAHAGRQRHRRFSPSFVLLPSLVFNDLRPLLFLLLVGLFPFSFFFFSLRTCRNEEDYQRILVVLGLMRDNIESWCAGAVDATQRTLLLPAALAGSFCPSVYTYLALCVHVNIPDTCVS